MKMRTPIETVTNFLTRFSEGKEGLYDSVRRWFTPDTVWENVAWAESRCTWYNQACWRWTTTSADDGLRKSPST